eukprot:1143963-Pleurochrysis_carterae.AAC.1
MVHSLEQQRLDALVRVAESLFAQQRQFSFWTLQPQPKPQIDPTTTSVDIIKVQARIAEDENDQAKTGWNNHRSG